MTDNFDVVIIGGGPAGASAAIYTSRAQLKTLIIDMAIDGGALGKTNKIANYPGFDEELSGKELLANIRRQAEKFGAIFHKGKVAGVDLPKGKTVYTSEGETFRAKALIISSGALGRASNLVGEQEFLGKGVSYCATCDGAFFKDVPVAVVGDSQYAVEEAEFLTRFAKEVHFISLKTSIPSTFSPKIIPHWQTSIKQIIGDNGRVSAILTSQGDQIATQGVFLYLAGNKPSVDYLFNTIALDQNGAIIVNAEMATNVNGVFACGDVISGAIKQVVIACASGCLAALATDKFIQGRDGLKVDYH